MMPRGAIAAASRRSGDGRREPSEVRRSIVLPGDVDRKISKVAFSKGKSANELIVKILREGLSEGA